MTDNMNNEKPLRTAEENARRVEERRRIGALLKAEREKQGIGLRELAEKCGIDHSHLVRIESGRYNITIDILSLVAGALGKRINID